MKTYDNVNNPAHYQPKFETRPIECIDIARHLSFSLGNAFKYVWRAGSKGGRDKALEDLEKAEWYLRDAGSDANEPHEEAKRYFDMLVADDSGRYKALWGIVYGYRSVARDGIADLKREFGGTVDTAGIDA